MHCERYRKEQEDWSRQGHRDRTRLSAATNSFEGDKSRRYEKLTYVISLLPIVSMCFKNDVMGRRVPVDAKK